MISRNSAEGFARHRAGLRVRGYGAQIRISAGQMTESRPEIVAFSKAVLDTVEQRLKVWLVVVRGGNLPGFASFNGDFEGMDALTGVVGVSKGRGQSAFFDGSARGARVDIEQRVGHGVSNGAAIGADSRALRRARFRLGVALNGDIGGFCNTARVKFLVGFRSSQFDALGRYGAMEPVSHGFEVSPERSSLTFLSKVFVEKDLSFLNPDYLPGFGCCQGENKGLSGPCRQCAQKKLFFPEVRGVQDGL